MRDTLGESDLSNWWDLVALGRDGTYHNVYVIHSLRGEARRGIAWRGAARRDEARRRCNATRYDFVVHRGKYGYGQAGPLATRLTRTGS